MKKILNFLVPVLVIVLGVVFIVTGVNKIKTKDLYDSTVTATIVDVEEVIDDTDIENPSTELLVYIDYEVNGVKYEHVEAPGYSGNVKVGDTMEILYQSKDPSKISGKDISKTAAIFIAVGAVAALIGVGLEIRAIKVR